MRILLTSPSMQVGGAERVVAMLLTGLAARGHEVALAAPHGVRDLDLLDVPHLRLALEDHGRSPIGILRSASQLAGAVREASPEVVHAQNVRSAVTARIAANLARPRRRPRVLATFHGVLPSEYRRSARLLHAADHVACVSADLLNGIVATGLPKSRASVIHNAVSATAPLDATRGAELAEELGLTGAQTVAIVGRIVPEKAHERFVVAAEVITKALPDVQFLIVGEGLRRQEIEQRVAAAGLEDRVRFTGARADARDLIALAEIVAFSSVSEGLSIAALEALSAGTPVVSTDVPGMRGLLASGAGMIVGLDDGTALGESIVELLRDEPRRLAMGRVGRALVAHDFRLEHMIDSYERLYEDLIRAG